MLLFFFLLADDGFKYRINFLFRFSAIHVSFLFLGLIVNALCLVLLNVLVT